MDVSEIPAELGRKILAAAESYGTSFDDVSMDEIASVTGVPRATLYYHFRSKEQVLPFLLTAMLSQSEVSQVSAFTRQFAGHAAMPAIGDDIVRFFGAPDAPGCYTLRGLVQERRAIDLTRFCAVLRELFAA